MYIRQTKNDSKDSFIIAQVIRFSQFSNTTLSEESIMALLDQVFPEYSSLFSDTFGVTSKELLSKYPTPEDMIKVNSKKLTALINQSSRGRFNIEKAEQIKKAAKDSFGIKFAKDAFRFQIKQIINQIIFIENQLRDLEKEISTLLHKTNQVITTIIGIGDVLGAIIIGEIGDISRFDKASKLVAFAGLDVSVKQSGEFLGTQNKISKRGSPYLRRAIWTAYNVAAFSDPVLSVYYQSLRDKGKHHLTAIGAVARKMCNIIFAVLRDNKPYTPIHSN